MNITQSSAPAASRLLFAGHQVRALRRKLALSQGRMAAELGISVSYLSQIESGDRPLTRAVLTGLATRFPADWAAGGAEEEAALLARLLEACADPSAPDPTPDMAGAHDVSRRHPSIARRLVALHASLRRTQEQLRVLDDRATIMGGASERLPWEEVRDWFHLQQNYVDPIDREAERIAGAMAEAAPAARLEARLLDRFGVRVEPFGGAEPLVRDFDANARILRLDPAQAPETRLFSIAHQLGRLEMGDLIDGLARSGLSSKPARELLAAGLANYAAGALLMPYAAFRAAARDCRHDVDRLRQRFGGSFEQTCHRLSTLQRPGAEGIPVFFCRVDMAGNITKRHSATSLQFARFGGNCPLWVVHEAVAIPDRILVQLAEMPDGARYVCMAKGLVKPSGSYARMPRRYAVSLGCEVGHAAEFIYADGVQPGGAATPIGVSCRICPRPDCEQRAFPPAASDIRIDPNRRGAVPYRFD